MTFCLFFFIEKEEKKIASVILCKHIAGCENCFKRHALKIKILDRILCQGRIKLIRGATLLHENVHFSEYKHIPDLLRVSHVAE